MTLEQFFEQTQTNTPQKEPETKSDYIEQVEKRLENSGATVPMFNSQKAKIIIPKQSRKTINAEFDEMANSIKAQTGVSITRAQAAAAFGFFVDSFFTSQK
jgi:hypothetical protein